MCIYIYIYMYIYIYIYIYIYVYIYMYIYIYDFFQEIVTIYGTNNQIWGGGGNKIRKLPGLKLYAPPSRKCKSFHSPLLKGGNILCPPSV